jgi:hypothetical protein
MKTKVVRRVMGQNPLEMNIFWHTCENFFRPDPSRSR